MLLTDVVLDRNVVLIINSTQHKLITEKKTVSNLDIVHDGLPVLQVEVVRQRQPYRAERPDEGKYHGDDGKFGVFPARRRVSRPGGAPAVRVRTDRVLVAVQQNVHHYLRFLLVPAFRRICLLILIVKTFLITRDCFC